MYNRLKSLRSQHNTLDSLIRREELHPYPDTQHIRSLKKFKLRLRDEISRIEGALSASRLVY
ncbi:YdcH family protein [uncultured Roseibium sp.]|uniref:YdcH family protein n=1 Tax=uncultured Roseibium sp. TaxID=1936171 RepID=UPI00260E71BB|nr:YdcH family protein [uncultured Roseibium sp.]